MLAPVSANNRTVIGIHACREVLKVRPKKVNEIWLRRDYERQSELVFFAEWAKKNGKKMSVRDEGFLNKIAASHQGIAVIVGETPELDLDDLAALPPEKKVILLALDEITDPHNIGAILRSAWLMGAKGLLVPEHRAGGLTPSAMKVASGGAEHVPLLVVKNLQQELKSLKDIGFWIYGLAGEGQCELFKLRLNEKVVWVVGSEEKGIRASVRGTCDELVKIPQTSADASYNASVAAAIALYETHRQQQATL
jgi:23S rRNA (guanosine2251-2'-O)-methyltransferase